MTGPLRIPANAKRAIIEWIRYTNTMNDGDRAHSVLTRGLLGMVGEPVKMEATEQAMFDAIVKKIVPGLGDHEDCGPI